MDINMQEFKRMIKFGITGVLNTLIDMAVFFLLSSWLNVNVYAAQVCGYAAGMLNSYLINRSWTFHSQSRFFSLEAVKFLLGNLFVLALSMLPIKLCEDVLRLTRFFTKIVTTCFTLVLNFFISRFWIFRNTKNPDNDKKR